MLKSEEFDLATQGNIKQAATKQTDKEYIKLTDNLGMLKRQMNEMMQKWVWEGPFIAGTVSMQALKAGYSHRKQLTSKLELPLPFFLADFSF